jgi:hypothetical protein
MGRMNRKEYTMTKESEIVRALRHRADAANKRGYSGEASEWLEFADLIESLQAKLAEKDAEIKRLNDESPAYKFYYCESEDSYLLGYRVGNFYYAHWHEGVGFVWDMSRYLPWGETIDGRERACTWGVHTYPSKPIEMGTNEWFRGFLAQRLAALRAEKEREWISVEDGLPDMCGYKCLVVGINKFGQTEVFTAFTGYMERGKLEFHSCEPTIEIPAWTVTHWMPLPSLPSRGAWIETQ